MMSLHGPLGESRRTLRSHRVARLHRMSGPAVSGTCESERPWAREGRGDGPLGALRSGLRHESLTLKIRRTEPGSLLPHPHAMQQRLLRRGTSRDSRETKDLQDYNGQPGRRASGRTPNQHRPRVMRFAGALSDGATPIPVQFLLANRDSGLVEDGWIGLRRCPRTRTLTRAPRVGRRIRNQGQHRGCGTRKRGG
jgi:hypothetical protein